MRSLAVLAGATSLAHIITSGHAAATPFHRRSSTCTLTASGGDDAPAFLAAAFDSSCSTILIPSSTTINIATPLNMTGIVDKEITVEGSISFNPDIEYWAGHAFYIPFQDQNTFWFLGGTNIILNGGGNLNGNGQVWYDEFPSNSTLVRPITLTIYQATNVTVENITMLNSPEWVNLVSNAENVIYRNVNISAVSTSTNLAKNTDGWDIYRSNNVVLENSVINNGDDCVSFKPNATNILVSNLNCNGSHGISVGSLGQYPGEYDIVANVTAVNVQMANAENGARIKAFAGPDVGYGIVKNITFLNFTQLNVDNPVIIDQCYETTAANCTAYPSNTYIEDVWFDNISGTSSGKEKAVVASLSCSPGSRCSNVNVNNISLSPPASYGTAEYTCQNVVLTGDDVSLFGNCTST